jgi:hypothetical protein
LGQLAEKKFEKKSFSQGDVKMGRLDWIPAYKVQALAGVRSKAAS